MNALISIITPVYNRADCVIRCLESVQAQQCNIKFEHVVVDDGSEDNSFELIQQFAGQHKNVKAHKLNQNSGTNAARNAAVKAAEGKYILLLDSDDTIAPGALQMIADTIAANPEIKHFMFATDDRLEYYRSLNCSEGAEMVFSFRDLLEGKVGGDFAHVLLRGTMTKFPFEEKLRIFEGVFFLSFYKEAGKMLFTNRTVLNRDRSRDDRVTYSLIANNKNTLRRSIDAGKTLIERFRDDYMATPEGRLILSANLKKSHRFATMLGDYAYACFCEKELESLGVKAPALYRLLNHSRTGKPFFFMARHIINLKYRFWKKPE